MPTYEFLCQRCRKRFDLALSFSEHERQKRGRFRCPKCKSLRVVQQISPFEVKTSKKS
ncbi:MAG: zinc ribbon domain-containing protein [Deltaproteobacteria bacterium]|nr:zinc ribbon domain-containing protein [Deltaproteobacteria bacterium]